MIGAVLGSEVVKRRAIPPEVYDSPLIAAALDAIAQRWPQAAAPEGDASPVFVLSAGWGSGSTLLQRLVMSSGRVFLWGEPFDQCAVIQRLTNGLVALREDWPPDWHFREETDPEKLTTEWIANLLPPVSSLRTAHRQFVGAWLGDSLPDASLRWGLKEVRLTVEHAKYLKWLYPPAKFLFLVRDPADSYRSCLGVNWYSIWPDYKVRPPVAFAHHWRHLVEGFLTGYESVGGMFIRYEDLVSGDFDLQGVADYLEVDRIDPGLLEQKVGARSEGKKGLNPVQRAVIRGITGTVADRVYA
ncbi:MAG: sulfotransferase [Pseudomonadota bacterium]|nr:sulfotransferase [Pseudomonadota bacterium]